jgi:predicted dehydrogenase
MNSLRTAILGCGGWGTRHAQNLVNLTDRVSLTAFCDTRPDAAAALSAKYGAPGAQVFNDHHEMFERADFDLIFICLPPFAHSDEVELAAERGIHLLIEKPIAMCSEDAWKMVAAAEKAGIVTQVGFMYRFGSAVQALKRKIKSGEAGAPGLITARYFCNSLHTPWWIHREMSGGQLVEQAIHLIDLMRFFFGEAEQVFSMQRNLFHTDVPGYTVEDVSGTVIGFQNGAVGVLSATNGAVPQKWIGDYRVVTRNLTADFEGSNAATFTDTSQRDAPWGFTFPVETIRVDQDDYLLEELDLLDAIATGKPTLTPMREGAKTLDLVLAAAQSAQARQPVTLKH